nr:integrase, catalytic region, zinc finger, CCHC-type, peptidase aspartic, catalytic [Tanacetum cinerariifolium]
LIVVLGIAPLIANKNANQNENGNVVAVRAEEDIDEIEDVNANCVLMDNLHQALTSGIQIGKALVYDSDDIFEVPDSYNCCDNENDSNVIPDASSMEQSGRIVDQNRATAEETCAHFGSLYNNLSTEVERVNMVNRKMRETNADLTTELFRYKDQEKSFEINKEKFDELETGYRKSVYQEQNLKLFINFIWKFMGTIRFGNDHIAAILGYGDLLPHLGYGINDYLTSILTPSLTLPEMISHQSSKI